MMMYRYLVDALFLDAGHVDGTSPLDDNDGWRCYDQVAKSTSYSIERASRRAL
jgi:hypothetical protein